MIPQDTAVVKKESSAAQKEADKAAIIKVGEEEKQTVASDEFKKAQALK
jgi:hypothetical protein